MRLIDLDDHRVAHLLCNLDPKWKPMAELGEDELYHELGSIIEEFDKLVITDLGEISDGYHTFNSLYHQRLILFATLVNVFPEQSWKSHKDSDGAIPFGGGWFIVGINTPEGQYTYHYEDKNWDIFHCQEVEIAPAWDGHTDKDVERLLSLVSEPEKDSMFDWAVNEVKLAIESEKDAAKDTDDWKYGAACYESALRAYRSLFRDHHTGFSIQATKSILNRLVDGRCLTPIEDTPDNWNEISSKDGVHEYQCRRMSSLFKRIDKDGNVSYLDVDRVYGVDVSAPDVSFTSGFLDRLIDKIFPIRMPYLPSSKRFRVTCDKFRTDPKNKDDYDTIAYYYIQTPNGRIINLNRYFKDENGKMVQIEKTEFDERKAKRVDKK